MQKPSHIQQSQKAPIRFSISAFSVHVSHPYRKTDVTGALNRLNLDVIVMLLSFHIGFRLARADVATAILILTS